MLSSGPVYLRLRTTTDRVSTSVNATNTKGGQYNKESDYPEYHEMKADYAIPGPS